MHILGCLVDCVIMVAVNDLNAVSAITMLMGRYHPDKNTNNPEAAELFKEVAYSYSILSDPEKRRQYDSAGFEVCSSNLLYALP